jgi:hypothetical protein
MRRSGTRAEKAKCRLTMPLCQLLGIRIAPLDALETELQVEPSGPPGDVEARASAGVHDQLMRAFRER